LQSFNYAGAVYIPNGKVGTKIHFFAASRHKLKNRERWADYCKKPVHYYEVEGDHFSIFKMPDVEAFAETFNGILKG
ncbi:MAG: hypothetical protein GY940_22495, partial [bacterium]|nr:hypothetical protein [bacterium]